MSVHRGVNHEHRSPGARNRRIVDRRERSARHPGPSVLVCAHGISRSGSGAGVGDWILPAGRVAAGGRCAPWRGLSRLKRRWTGVLRGRYADPPMARTAATTKTAAMSALPRSLLCALTLLPIGVAAAAPTRVDE